MTERQQYPNLQPVIDWLERGCDPIEAAKELRLYQAMQQESALDADMARVAADMLAIAHRLDARAGEIDSRPGGFTAAAKWCDRARALDASSRTLDEWARELKP
jgi:hypothetical protein